LVIRLVDNEEKKFYSFYELFKVRLPLLATPYETFEEDGKKFKGLSFKCSKEVMELLLEYVYTGKIEFDKWDMKQIFSCILLCISYRSYRPTSILIRYLITSLNTRNACYITQKAYELKLFTSEYQGELKDICHNFFMISLKFIVNFWDLVTVLHFQVRG